MFLATLFENLTGLENVDMWLQIAIMIVAALIVLIGLASGIVSIVLAIKYVKFNRTDNHIGLTGEDVARKILDDNGLNHIRVSKNGSLLFGNSYSHYFKKVRLRRLTYRKKSISSLAMAAQKSSLAILDKEGDKDMKSRVILTPIITFGPLAFIPLIIIGVLIDILVFGFSGKVTFVFAILGLAFYVLSFILSINTLKVEIKAQNRAYEILKTNNMATEQELEMMKELFHLYNIEYVNDMILAFLEMLYRVLMIVAKAQSAARSNND